MTDIAETFQAVRSRLAPSGLPTIDWTLFFISVGTILAACLPMLLFPEASVEVTSKIYGWITGQLGLLYQWAAIGCMVVLAVIAFGKYGKVRLGGDDTPREYSLLAWMGMLFCSGIGAGLLYWTPIEWAFYLDTPPLGVERDSPMAVELAASYGIFHWGFSAWAIYALPAVAIAVPYYQRKVPYLRLSTALCGIAGDDIATRPAGRLVDFCFIIAMVAGTGTSLGLATPAIAACISMMFGVDQGMALDAAVAVIAMSLFALSVYLGLDAGIKRLSMINLGLGLVFVMFILAVGPTVFILETGSNSVGLLLQDFIRMNTWTDPVTDAGFVEAWTIFYWAWWLAYAPFMGIFVSRISRGRTLREVIIGMIGLGTAGCAVFFIIIGNTAMWFDLNDVVALKDLVITGDEPLAIAKFVAELPLYPIAMVIYLVLAFIFIATTYDSASYVIASMATQRLRAGEHPIRWHRVFWAFMLIVLPITLMYIDDLTAVKNASIIASIPLLVIFVLITIALFKELKDDDERRVKSAT